MLVWFASVSPFEPNATYIARRKGSFLPERSYAFEIRQTWADTTTAAVRRLEGCIGPITGLTAVIIGGPRTSPNFAKSLVALRITLPIVVFLLLQASVQSTFIPPAHAPSRLPLRLETHELWGDYPRLRRRSAYTLGRCC